MKQTNKKTRIKIQRVCVSDVIFAGGGGPAGQLHRRPAAGPERALLLVLVAVAPVVAAQLTDRAGEAAQPGEAATGAGLPAEAAGRSGRGEAEEGERVGAE